MDRDTLAGTRPAETRAMNRPQPFRSNAANAVVELDCPWCLARVPATVEELDEGLTCSACNIRMDVAHAEIVGARDVVPIAA